MKYVLPLLLVVAFPLVAEAQCRNCGPARRIVVQQPAVVTHVPARTVQYVQPAVTYYQPGRRVIYRATWFANRRGIFNWRNRRGW